jgi:hypothetical protein
LINYTKIIFPRNRNYILPKEKYLLIKLIVYKSYRMKEAMIKIILNSLIYSLKIKFLTKTMSKAINY